METARHLRERLRKLGYSLLNFRYTGLLSSILFFVLIGTAFLIVYQNAGVMRDQIDSDFNQQQQALARQAAYQIEAYLHDVATDLDNLLQLMSTIPQGDWESVLQATFERRRSRGLLGMAVVDSTGTLLLSTRQEPSGPPFAPGVATDCRWDASGAMRLGPLRVIETSPGVPAVSGLICSRTATGSLAGSSLFAQVNVSELIGSATSHIRSGKTGYAWTVNEAGVFLCHPEQEFVGKNAFTARKERRPKISFEEINNIMKEQMLLGQEGTGTYVSGWHRGIHGDITKLIAFAPVASPFLEPAHVWSVAVVAPISEVAEPVRRLSKRNLVTEAVLLVGMFVFGMVVAIHQNRMSEALRKRVQQTEADLHKKETLYERVVEQATDLIYVFDLDMRFVILNQQTVDMFADLLLTEAEGLIVPAGVDKMQREFWRGKRLDQLMSSADAAFERRKIDEVVRTNRSLSFEHTIKHKGRQVHLSTKLIPIRYGQSQAQHILGISRDVTQKMEMDQRIYTAEKLASIGILASGVAHEINNPLAIILGFCELLLERAEEGSREQEDLKMIQQSAKHAEGVVQSLLGFARVTEGLEDSVNLRESMETVGRIVSNTLMTKKIRLITDIPDDLPRVRGDAREYQQVLFNLINNSVAAMIAHEGCAPVLELAARADHEWVHMSVTDNGVGIPNRIKPLVLDPFFTTKKPGEGTGLGLSLCYGIVKKYGGKLSFSSVSAEDSPDRPAGTTFVVSMPIKQDGDVES
jgi:signal transduction histidine kinase